MWNRTDGGKSISDRLKGFKIVLLDERRDVIWEDSPAEVPAPSQSTFARGAIPLRFDAAHRGLRSRRISGEVVIGGKPDHTNGWAISPKHGQPHELTLVMKEPMQLADGVLTCGSTKLRALRPPAGPFSSRDHCRRRCRTVGSECRAPFVKLFASKRMRTTKARGVSSWRRTIAESLRCSHRKEKELEKTEKQLRRDETLLDGPVMRRFARRQASRHQGPDSRELPEHKG